jgi:membrane-bound lytic murein transglycosylase D
MRIVYALFFAGFFPVAAQPYAVPQVPHKLNFAGITLTIRDDAQREIQKDVDALWQSPKHFNTKVERAKTYFPIIEKIFAEERVPDDFKYLVLQESALIADAVSVSNAVGFWQFKDFTAMEMGLRVDEIIDERMNIFSATRGAAKYIKRNNYQFNNWVYALQAYQMGAGGVARSVKDVESGARHMHITSSTYWYVKKFLAHKIAFENSISGKPVQPISSYENSKQKSVEEVAADLSIKADELLAFNKWIRKGIIPDDRVYAVLVPLAENRIKQESLEAANTVAVVPPKSIGNRSMRINGVPAIQANAGESLAALATRAQVSLPSFMSYNDLRGNETVIANAYYFTARKKPKAEKEQVLAKASDDLWVLSQEHGVSLNMLKKYNRTDDIILQPGQVVWLASKMPKKPHIERSNQLLVTPDEKFFNWGAHPDDTATVSIPVSPTTIHQLTPPIQDTLQATVSAAPPVQADSTTISATPRIHIVQAGENLYAISKQYGIALADLAAWNQLGNNYNLSHNQELKLLDDQSISRHIEPAEVVHKVKPSDTLYGIARQYGITIKELMDWNNKTDFTLTIGEKLRILKK